MSDARIVRVPRLDPPSIKMVTFVIQANRHSIHAKHTKIVYDTYKELSKNIAYGYAERVFHSTTAAVDQIPEKEIPFQIKPTLLDI